MGSFSPIHWLILLVVVLLVFGTKKLRGAGKDLGGAVKGFKDAMQEDEQEAKKIEQNNDKQSVTVDNTVSEKQTNNS